jgi:plasmid stability protein
MQYTLRNIPSAVDTLLRRRAKEEGRSLNEVALEALRRGLGLAAAPLQQRDLTDIAGTWETDRTTDAILAEQRQIDPDLWR